MNNFKDVDINYELDGDYSWFILTVRNHPSLKVFLALEEIRFLLEAIEEKDYFISFENEVEFKNNKLYLLDLDFEVTDYMLTFLSYHDRKLRKKVWGVKESHKKIEFCDINIKENKNKYICVYLNNLLIYKNKDIDYIIQYFKPSDDMFEFEYGIIRIGGQKYAIHQRISELLVKKLKERKKKNI